MESWYLSKSFVLASSIFTSSLARTHDYPGRLTLARVLALLKQIPVGSTNEMPFKPLLEVNWAGNETPVAINDEFTLRNCLSSEDTANPRD